MQRENGDLWIAPRHGQEITQYHIAQGDSNDCGPHVVTMALNFWLGHHTLDAPTVAKEMNRPRVGMRFPPLVVRRIPNWATFPWGITDTLSAHGVHACWQMRASEEDLHRALRDDRIVMPIFGEPLHTQGWHWRGWSHIAILAGWSPANETYWFVDSARLTTPTSRPRAEFIRLWRNMGRILITSEN